MVGSGVLSCAEQGGRKRTALLGRTALLVSADSELRGTLADTLLGLRWEVRESAGGADLFSQMEELAAGTILLDSWLPDLEIAECVQDLARLYPSADILAIDGTDFGVRSAQGAYRNEVLHALSRVQQVDDAAWNAAQSEADLLRTRTRSIRSEPEAAVRPRPIAAALPELLGSDPRMLEVGRRIRLVAPRSTAVLVQGPTGTGKELVARALHRLSPRATRPFVALNCAAIPEALLEAELFGHTRGAFTGAVQGRIGRLEAANGGTLFLDEIGELPLALQAKLLRFVECGELQRVGENEPVRVDVRIVAATHRRLSQMAAAGSFRADLYYRLSVFLIQTPALAGRDEDIRTLAQHALDWLARNEAPKTLTAEALDKLLAHSWPGNVRELEHTLERAWILADGSGLIEVHDVDFGEAVEA